MFIRLNRHLVVRALDAAVEQARARVARSAQKSAAAQTERSNVDLLLWMPRMDMWMSLVIFAPLSFLPVFVYTTVC